MLDHIKLESTSIKIIDARERESAPSPTDKTKAKDTGEKVDAAKADVDKKVDSAKQVLESLRREIESVSCPKQSTSCLTTNELMEALNTVEPDQPLPGKIGSLLEMNPTLKQPTASAREEYSKAKKAISARVEKLRQDLSGLGTDQVVPKDANKTDDLDKVQAALATAKQRANSLADWGASSFHGAAISAHSETLLLPTGAENFEYEVTIKNEITTKGADGKDHTTQRWPNARLTIRINHGRYFFDYGLMFTAVAWAKRIDDNGKASCPDSCRWDAQAMFSATAWILGRNKNVGFSWRNLVSGIQAGVNADLTKVTDAMSIGVAFEQVSGFTLSGGVMFKTRVRDPRAMPDADGNRPTEHRWLPFVGVTFSTDLYNSIKGLGDGGKAKEAKDSDTGK